MDRWDIVSTRPGKDGKKAYHKLGVMFRSRDGEGFSIKLDSLPLPNEKGEVWLSGYVPKHKDGFPQGQRPRSQEELDDTPF
jgi:hypothetical protein